MSHPTTHIRSFAHLGLIAALAASTACGSDSSTPTTPTLPPGVSATGVKLAIDSVSNLQTATVGTPISVTAHLTNATDGTVAPGQTVTWTVSGGAGKVASATTTTDAQGATTMAWTLDTLAGTNQLTAGIPGATVLIYATGTAGALTSLKRVTADSQVVVGGGSMAFVVKSVDKYGNPVDSIPITWSASGGVLTPSATITGAAGNATVTFTADPAPAKYTITAIAGALQVAFALSGI
jgi:adhesin/invasin